MPRKRYEWLSSMYKTSKRSCGRRRSRWPGSRLPWRCSGHPWHARRARGVPGAAGGRRARTRRIGADAGRPRDREGRVVRPTVGSRAGVRGRGGRQIVSDLPELWHEGPEQHDQHHQSGRRGQNPIMRCCGNVQVPPQVHSASIGRSHNIVHAKVRFTCYVTQVRGLTCRFQGSAAHPAPRRV